jgi:hypothetical protein
MDHPSLTFGSKGIGTTSFALIFDGKGATVVEEETVDAKTSDWFQKSLEHK